MQQKIPGAVAAAAPSIPQYRPEKNNLSIPKVSAAPRMVGSTGVRLPEVTSNNAPRSIGGTGISLPDIKQRPVYTGPLSVPNKVDPTEGMSFTAKELAAADRKLTSAEVLYAKKLLKDYDKRARQNFWKVTKTPEELQEMAEMQSLRAKISAASSAGAGVMQRFGADALERNAGKVIADNPQLREVLPDTDGLNTYEAAQTQHPGAYMTGQFVGESIKYKLGAEIVPKIPGVGNGITSAGTWISGKLGGKISAEVVARLLTGRAVDLPIDVANAAMETDNIQDFAKNLGINTAIGAGSDALLEFIGFVWKAARRGVPDTQAGRVSISDEEMRKIMAEEFSGGNAIRETYEPQALDVPTSQPLLDNPNFANQPIAGTDFQNYMESGTRRKTLSAKQNYLSDYGDPIITTRGQQEKFIADAISGKNKGIAVIGKVGDNMANAVNELTGGAVDLSGKYLELDASHIRHAISKHTNDTIPITKEQLYQLPQMILNYDDLLKVEQGTSGKTSILLGKKINGYSVIVELVSDSRNSIFPTTIYNVDTDYYLKHFSNKIKNEAKVFGRDLTDIRPSRNALDVPQSNASINSISNIPTKSNTNLLDQLAVKPKELSPDDPIVRSIGGDFGGHSVGAAESAYPRTQKVSRVRSNTIENSPMFSTAEKELMNPSDFKYDVVKERQSLREAAQRLQVDFDGEVKTLFDKQTFDGTDIDTAFGILERYRQEARGLPADSPEQRRVIEWVKRIQEKGTEAGQRVQAFAKYSRTPEGAAVKAQKTVADEWMKLQKSDPNLVKAMDDLADKLTNIAREYEHELPADPQEVAANLRRAITELSNDKAYRRLGLDEEFTDMVVKSLQEGRAGKDYFADVLKEFEGIPTLTSGELIDIMDIMAKAENLPQFSRERFEVEKQAYKIVADKFNASFMDKWNAWRYMAMLGNSRTHLSNMLGNAMFGTVTRIKNDIGAVMEAGVDKVSRAAGRGGIDRTKSLLNPLNVRDNALKDAARGDYDNVYALITGGGKYNPARLIEDQKTVFDHKWLEWLRKKNFDALEWEDSLALKTRYTENLSRYMKANGLDASAFQSADKQVLEILEAGRAHAIEEAQKATFRDANSLASWLSNMSYSFRENGTVSGKIGSAMIEGAIPFKKTPANIVKRGVEYSPVGLLKGVYDGVKSIRKGSVPASKVIDELAAGLTGTGIMGLGAFLASQGWLTDGGSSDSKERGFDALRGNQNYALKIGDKSYTLDWAAPAALPLFVGVQAFNDWKDAHESGEFPDFIDSLTQITQPVLEMTMLQGLNDMIKSARYSDGRELASIGMGALMNLATQGIPTLFGQVARAVDPLRRTIYNDPNSKIPGTNIRMPEGLSTTLQKAAAKIPGVSTYLQPKTDQWGRTQENVGGSFLGRLAYNMLSPGFYSETRETPADALLDSLYKDIGETALLPTSAQKSFASDGEKIRLTGAQYTRANQTRGQTANAIIGSLGESPVFAGLSSEDKQKVISDAYAYATALGKATTGKYEPDGWIEKARTAEKAGVPVDSYILYKNAFSDLEGYEAPDGTYVSKQDQQAKMLLDDVTLTKKQKNLLDELMISDVTVIPRETKRDFSSPEALAISEMPEAARKLWEVPSVQKAVGSVENYEKVQKILAETGSDKDEYGNAVSGTAKPKAVREIARKLNITSKNAEEIYNEVAVYKHSLDELSTKQRQSYEALSGKYRISEQRFLDCLNRAGVTEGTKGRNGKTISGSLKQNRYRALREMGLNDKAAKVFLSEVYRYKW
jgi:hypothetical protein